jgi:5-oxoprolinase (ATP-hydrolysing) subunit A
MTVVDLNCDLGEGGGYDAELMALITSANIACGGHAGDEATMRTAVKLGLKHGVSTGAHPGYADRECFGRRELDLSAPEIEQLVRAQTDTLVAITREYGTTVTHVKPHGALYNQAARDPLVADAIARAVRSLDGNMILVGLSGSELISAGRKYGLRVAQEAFADRNYLADGTLAPRSMIEAVIKDPTAAARRALRMCREQEIEALGGSRRAMVFDTLCLHGDGLHAVSMARELRRVLTESGIGPRSLLTNMPVR